MGKETIGLWAAAIAFLGVIVGSGLNFLFQRAQKTSELSISEKQKAFTNYLECLGDYAIHGRDDPKQETMIEKRAKLTAAKAKICVYGSQDVLAKMGEFERIGSNLADKNARLKFVDLIDAMRSDAGLTSNKNDIDWILLGGTAND